jgi:hypothetical protein
MAIRTMMRTIQSQVGTMILSLGSGPTLRGMDEGRRGPEGGGAVEAISMEAYPVLYCGNDSAERPTSPPAHLRSFELEGPRRNSLLLAHAAP